MSSVTTHNKTSNSLLCYHSNVHPVRERESKAQRVEAHYLWLWSGENQTTEVIGYYNEEGQISIWYYMLYHNYRPWKANAAAFEKADPEAWIVLLRFASHLLASLSNVRSADDAVVASGSK